jgi:hypothetical protein
MKQVYLLLFAISTIFTASYAQNAMRRESKIKVLIDGDTLANPWAGGFHAPQFNEADMDGDGYDDLVIFNRGILASNPTSNGFKLMVFKNDGIIGQSSYTHKPEWESRFPSLLFWLKMYDINCDGLPDLVSANQGQGPFFNWYEAKRDNNNMMYFEYRDTVNTSSIFAPVGLSRIHYPGIGDLDRDGDPDFVNFGDFGSFMLYNSTAVETTGSCQDTVGYEITENCWGEFFVTFGGVQTHIVCPFKTDPMETGGNSGSARHNGGSVLIIDLDGDGDDDALYTEIDKGNVFALYNDGDSSYAIIDYVDGSYPSYDVPATLNYYPLPFTIDANNNNKTDIVVAPSEPMNCISKNAVWLYENVSTNDSVILKLKQTDFLEDGMIELGVGSFPVFVDYNGDSLLDLVVGNQGYYRDSLIVTAQLALFINVGTAEVPIFELVDDDWLNYSDWYFIDSKVVMALRPAFGDIDSDGDLDLFVGDTSGYVTFFENLAGRADTIMNFAPPVLNYFDMYAGRSYSAPFLYDVNGDGLTDLLIGNRSGKVVYFENHGTTTAPYFDAIPTNPFFGGINVSTGFSLFGYAGPVIATLDSTGQLYVLSGNEEGSIYGYKFDQDSIYSGTFLQVFNAYSDIDAGERSAITVADVTNDGRPEMIVGNYRGGLEFFTLSDTIENILSVQNLASVNIGVSIFPNPTTGNVSLTVTGIKVNQTLTYSVTDMLGKMVHSNTVHPSQDNWNGGIPLGQFPAGLYIVNVSQGAVSKSIKLIKY